MNNDLIAQVFSVEPSTIRVASVCNAIDEEEWGVQYRPEAGDPWVDLFEDGKPVVLNNKNTVVWLKAPGEYRCVPNTEIYKSEVMVGKSSPVTYMVNATNG